MLDKHPIAREFKMLLERRVDFAKWGFSLLTVSPVAMAEVLLVYESPRCRVRFGFQRGMYASPGEQVGEGIEDHMFYGYGRLHAPPFGDDIVIDERVYVAWHDPYDILRFIDHIGGRVDPAESSEVGASPPTWQVCVAVVARLKDLGRIERWAAAIAASWELVGDELFELLDLNRPDLWEAYVAFRKMRWELIRRKKLETLGDRAQASIDLLAPSYEQEVA